MMSRNLCLQITSVTCCLGFAILVLADDDSGSNSAVRELQSQKLEVLEDIVARYQFGYTKGRPVLEELLDAEHELLQAKLDVASSQADRLNQQELIVENRRRLVEARIAGHKLGHHAEVDILTARVAHIDAKIALTRTRGSSEPAQ